jgi:K+-transporting ATPase KdpF subunit
MSFDYALAAFVVIAIAVYLLVALLRPEKF